MTNRTKEIKVANVVADILLADERVAKFGPTINQLAHAYGLACEQAKFCPDDASTRRITDDVSRVIAGRKRVIERLNYAVIKATSDLAALRRA